MTEVEVQRRMRVYYYDILIALIKRAVKPEQQSSLIATIARDGAAFERELRGRK